MSELRVEVSRVVLAVGLAAALVLPGAVARAGGQVVAARSVAAIPASEVSGPGSGNVLLGVSCRALANCMAVGLSPPDSTSGVLAERWRGRAWKTVPVRVPRPVQAGAGVLSGVSCPSVTECVAVGSYLSVALAETWNGRAWTPAKPPWPRGSSDLGGGLSAVSCATARNCLAVGSYTLRDGDDAPLAESLRGTKWTLALPPAVKGNSDGFFSSVSCVSAQYCVAVGQFQTAAGSFVLIESWNGRSWRIMPAPDPAGNQYSVLGGVSCASRTRCVAVGGTDTDSGRMIGFSELWNGTGWTLVPVAWPRRTGNSFLISVSCVSAKSCMAVGGTGFPEEFFTGGKAAALRWDGKTWKSTAVPAAGKNTYRTFWSVSCLSARACVGTIQQQSSANPSPDPLSGFWNGTTWELITAQ